MNKKELGELKILARTECLILWDELAETGNYSKGDIIKKLYKQGKLSQEWYSCECPFCEYLRPLKSRCKECIWPIVGNIIHVRCQEQTNSPFIKWIDKKTNDSIKLNKKLAREVFDLIWNIEI